MEIKYLKDKNSIKIWPYLDDITQSLIPYSDFHLSKTSNMIVNLDFSNVKRISSSGATIALSKLISLLEGKKYFFKLVLPENEENLFVTDYLQKSCFLNILDQKIKFEKINLFEQIAINKNPELQIVYDEKRKIRTTSFPIFHLRYNKRADRESVDKFSDWITDILLNHLSSYNLKINVFLTLIREIAKNSQDHTGNDAFWGFDLIEYLESNTATILFSCSDLGKGIFKNVKDYLRLNDNNLREDAEKHFSYTDAYKFAFTTGNTTSRKTRNKGVGMSMILDGAKILNIDMSIWDGRSMLLIPKLNSHADLRRSAFDSGNRVGFYYYGKLSF